MTSRRARIASACIICMLMLIVNLGVATPALAREYSIPQVDIDATITADGSLEVREERVFSFDGSFNGVYWNLPQGEFQGRDVTVDVISAGEIEGGRKTAYELTDSGDDRTYSIEEYGSSLRLKIYARHSDEDAHFIITYRINNVVLRHADVAELYWQFVTEGWDVESQNISCTIHLPVPEGQSVVPEDTVRAWGHGPLDASLAFSGNDIVYTVPGIGSSEFAEARVVFPESWIPGAVQDSSSALADILQEEQREADKANRQRMNARIVYFGSMVVAGGAAAASVIFARIKRKSYNEAIKPRFDDDYFRDVPTDDHPAVLGALYHGGTAVPECFTATLMDLTNLGTIALQHVKIKHDGLFGSRLEGDYRLVLNKPIPPEKPNATRSERDAGRINRKAIDLMFEKVALGMADKDHAPGTYPPLYFSSIEDYAKEHASSYERAYDSWKGSVETAYEQRFATGGTVVELPASALVAAGVADIVLAALFFFISIVFGMPFPLIIAFSALLVASGVYAIVCGANRERANEEGRETKAKLEALRRWLKDFTRLDEAIPTDVVLWNRLLVMAVVLGVSEEVIKQLETVLPEVIHSDYLSPTYGWYYVSSVNSLSPARAFSSAVSTAHSVSTASTASSSWSSGGGGGGGFSGGGGGGFGGGGGGGGGAF